MYDVKKGKIKLITLNIEGDNHLSQVTKFLKTEDPDVVCLQEVFKEDVEYLKNTLNMQGYFSPMVSIRDRVHPRLGPRGLFGLLILTKCNTQKIESRYYVGTEDKIPIFNGDPNSVNRLLLAINLAKNNIKFMIVTTHFTWSPNGNVTPLQHDHLNKMLKSLNEIKEFVLCGDFNAPRGGEIYNRLAKLYKDNIPKKIMTTLDLAPPVKL